MDRVNLERIDLLTSLETPMLVAPDGGIYLGVLIDDCEEERGYSIACPVEKARGQAMVLCYCEPLPVVSGGREVCEVRQRLAPELVEKVLLEPYGLDSGRTDIRTVDNRYEIPVCPGLAAIDVKLIIYVREQR